MSYDHRICVGVIFSLEICAIEGYGDVGPMRVFAGSLGGEVMDLPHVLFALSLVVVVLVGTSGDCKDNSKG